MSRGGGSLPFQERPCIPPEEAARVRAEASAFVAQHPELFALPPPPGIAQYPFYPQAGKFWEDLFPNNFVDLDPTSPGILDYNGTGYTYDGHRGIDSDICTFSEQLIGIPVFAALDGVVTAAHDGEDDMNTVAAGQPANYVIVRHEGTHDTWYYHLKKNSVAVIVGQPVKAGFQLGLTASSGNSTQPHLHFQSETSAGTYEPFTGPFNPGASGWVNQIPFRTAMYIRDFNFTNQNLSSWPGPPIDTTRTGTILGLGVKNFYFWTLIASLPASSTYRIRFLRPDTSLRFDSGTTTFGGNPFYKRSYWWWNYNINFDVTGIWTLEYSVNGTVVVNAPLTLVAGPIPNAIPDPNTASRVVNITASFDPPIGYASQVMFCRVPFHVIDDFDYLVVRYRYLWQRNGTTIRDSTNASLADAIPAGICSPGDLLTCTVTPSDGIQNGIPVMISTTLRETFNEWTASYGIAGALPTDDTDRNGIPNIVKFLLNLSPTSPSALPQPTRNPATGVMSWQLTPNPALDPLITSLVETSTDLVSWGPAAFSSATNTWTAGNLTDAHRFMRLRVFYP